jgi:superfamily II DNA/RNA helicase
VPHTPEDYVHRIGRTGRAGRSGTAITIVGPADKKAVDAIEKLIGETIAWAGEPPRSSADEHEPRPERQTQHRGEQGRGRGRRGGQRGKSEAPRREPRQAPAPREPQRTPAPVARLDEARRRPPPRQESAEETDASHLPAFLLRPFSLKA